MELNFHIVGLIKYVCLLIVQCKKRQSLKNKRVMIMREVPRLGTKLARAPSRKLLQAHNIIAVYTQENAFRCALKFQSDCSIVWCRCL